MMRDDPDPVLTLVAALRTPRPTMAFEEQVRGRCHDVMERKARRRDVTPRLRRVADLALIGVVGGYAATALVQATQVAARVLALH
jgi:hypothetical protein